MRRAMYALALIVPTGEAAPNPLESLRLDDLSATRNRPLFAPSRRPPPSSGRPAESGPAPVEERAIDSGPPPFELVGTVVGTQIAFALLRNQATKQIVRLQAGDDADGWRMKEIAARSVALERDGRIFSLRLAAFLPSSGAVASAVSVQANPGAHMPAGAEVTHAFIDRHLSH